MEMRKVGVDSFAEILNSIKPLTFLYHHYQSKTKTWELYSKLNLIMH